MHSFAPVALATILAATAPARAQAQNETQPRAQTPTSFTVPQPTGHFTDPANLAGERVNPRNGRELPIDGGIGADGKPDNALGLAQILRKLNTRASLLLIVAHPDDEDGGMLAYYSRGLGARVAILTLNRGEGGQNQMTGDFEDALGLLRTQELLSADRYMGVDTQMFGTEVDFGFSKTKAEAFEKWNHQRVLYDAVRAVRIFRPLVIASVFEGAVTDGHGQHQVAGQIAQEVFKAAGDPSVFPELTKEGILPWQPLKVYARVPFSRVTPQGLYDYATGQTVPAEFTNYVTGQKFTTEPTADVTINEGTPDPLLTTCAANPSDLPASLRPVNTSADCQPLSYVQFARIGLGLQRSQIGGGDRVSRPGRVDVGYHLYGSRVCAPNLPNPTPNLCNSTQTTASNHIEPGWPTLSRTGVPGERSLLAGVESERVGYRAPREKTPTAPIILASFTNSKPPAVLAASTPSEAPTARSIPAQGNALGTVPNNDPRAEGPPYNPAANPALANQPSFFDDIDTSLAGIASLAPDAKNAVPLALKTNLAGIAKNIEAAQREVSDGHTDNAANDLATALKLADMTIENLSKLNPVRFPADEKENVLHELRIKRAQLNDALTFALGLNIDASAPDADVLVNSRVPVHIAVSTSTDQRIPYFGTELRSPTVSLTRGPLTDGSPAVTKATAWTVDITTTPQLTQSITRPYFFRTNVEQPIYELATSSLRGAPSSSPALTAWVNLSYQGTDFTIGRVVHAGPQPVQIIPPVSLTLDRHAQVVPDGTHSLTIDVHTETEDHPQGDLRLIAPTSWSIRSPQRPLRAGTESFFASLLAPLQTSTLKAEATISGTTYTEGFRPVGYGTLPRTNYYTPATLRVVPVDLKLPPLNKRRIAYLPGTGDDVPAALASIGLTPTILKVSDLTPATLSKFDTVVLGVRTYNAHPDLHGAPTQALLDFARAGGNVVVQYQTPEFTAADAPYPLTTHNERVIDETAPVSLLFNSQLKAERNPSSFDPASLLTTPNKITPADFNGWIEERGHGFLDTWDPHYTALTETHDPGAPAEHILPQAPQRGGLITVQLGKGRWTYVAFALYRQLPEAVPGAFRLFANLLTP